MYARSLLKLTLPRDRSPSNLSTVLTVLDDAFTLLPSTTGISPDLAEKVEACRGRAATQLRVLEKEVAELTMQSKGIDDKRAHTRGSVGCDGVG